MKLLHVKQMLLLCMAVVAMFSMSAHAAKDFADVKVVLQISDPNPMKQTLVLNVANNLIKHYGQDRVDVEIVAFGPGLRLLFAENSNKDRISSLAGNGVRFSACSNTVKAMSKKLGYAPELNSNAKTVPAGVVQIVDLVKKGYTLVKP
ncbi:MAG: DsrE family protein [Gammaproteobacteria bacterium]|nr:DsrE family protein [Gammaproteobacteria bacterium]MDH5652509.1 DsrE family protein [Gammaproteobacteria bacterium]